MLFNPRFFEKMGTERYAVTAQTVIDIDDDYFVSALHALDNEGIALSTVVTETELPSVLLSFSEAYDTQPEAFALWLDLSGCLHLIGKSRKARLLALATVQLLAETGELVPQILFDYPVCPVRGYRLYLPGREKIAEFKSVIDLLARYRFNHVILEVGGAMEYRSHPEINEKWVSYCADLHEYSGKTMEIQEGYPWRKNSFHIDNGDGGFLLQDEVRELVRYCKERGLQVIPEVPSMSHCDYLLLARPDLREREEDPYPDTYCPSHPDTYPFLFSILDEVIDVFEPEFVHIGHDELYSVGLCPRCRDKVPHVLYAEDICQIHNYLSERGIRTVMWGEKLLDARDHAGNTIGGALSQKYDHAEGKWVTLSPALYQVRSMLPKDILMLNWYWEFNPELDKVFHENGYSMVLGNLYMQKLVGWKQRIEWGVQGGFVSNWGSNEMLYLQRNNQLLGLITAAYAFWTEGYDDPQRDEMMEQAVKEVYAIVNREHKGYCLQVRHSTDYHVPYVIFFDGNFVDGDTYLLGHYRVRYNDGAEMLLPVEYQTNIGNSDAVRDANNPSYWEVVGHCYPVEEPAAPRKGLYFGSPSSVEIDYRTTYVTVYPTGRSDDPVFIEFIPAAGKEAVTVTLDEAKTVLI